MSTDGYENCEPGTFYGFSDNENNEYHPGDIFHLQWEPSETQNTRP